MSDDVYGKHYDDVVVAFEYLMHALIKVEVLRSNQFQMLLNRVAQSGLDSEQEQLLTTYLRAMRGDNIN